MNTHAPAILVVDDDPDTCRNMADVFAEMGYAIDTAEGGDSALEKARRQPYDLGLLDLRMPGMDGLTLCRHLKRLHPLMVAMIVTAYAGGLVEVARAAGARHVLTKPVDLPRLLGRSGTPWRSRISWSNVANRLRSQCSTEPAQFRGRGKKPGGVARMP